MEIGKCYWQNHVDTSFYLCAHLVFNWSSAWMQTCADWTLLISVDGFSPAGAGNRLYRNYELVHTVKMKGGLWKSRRKKGGSICNEEGGGKDHIPICPRHMFSMAQIFSLFGAFGKSPTSHGGAKTRKCTHLCVGARILHWHSERRACTFRRGALPEVSSSQKVPLMISLKTRRHCVCCIQRRLRCRGKINGVLFSSPVRSVYLYIDGCLVL